MHAAKLEKSARLQNMHNALRKAGGKGATTWELIHSAVSANVSSDISELRRNGIKIDCVRQGIGSGRAIYRYWLTELR